MKLIKNMRQFLSDLRDNDPEFSEKILDAIRDSLSDNSSGTLFWKIAGIESPTFIGDKFSQTSDVMSLNNPCDGYCFMVPANWANHCDWITFGKDEDGNETIMCPSPDYDPYVVHNFYELWDEVLDYYDFDIDLEIERIMDYWEKGYTNR